MASLSPFLLAALCLLFLALGTAAQTPVSIAFVPPPITVECGSLLTPNITGVANFTGTGCNVRPRITFSDSAITGGGCSKFFIRTFTASDGCGQTATASQIITITDTVAPVITLTSNATLQCGASTLPSEQMGAKAVDACSPQVFLSYTDGASAGGLCGLRVSFDRTWTARDLCGNTATAVQHIATIDNTPPLLFIPNNRVYECPAPSSLTPASLGDIARATDACTSGGVVTPTFSDAPQQYLCNNSSSVPSYILRRTWTATDACGLVTNGTQEIRVQDTRPPTITPLFNSTKFECNPALPIPATTVTPSDLCDPAPRANYTDTVVQRLCGRTAKIDRIWTVLDACGNRATFRHEVELVDTLGPVITTPADITINCQRGNTSSLLPDTTGRATGVDQCSPNVTVSYTDRLIPGCASVASVNRTWLVTDLCGLGNRTFQVITVRDNTPPVVVAPRPQTLECAASSANFVAEQARANDTCDPAVTVSVTGTINTAVVGTYTRTWNATDRCGNTATVTQSVFVNDTVPPSLTLPPNAVVECGNSTLPAATGTPVVTDRCDMAPVTTFSDRRVPGCSGDAGIIYRTWSAVDASGNRFNATQTITVVATKPPLVLPPPKATVPCTSPTTVAALGNATILSVCGPANLVSITDTIVSTGCGGNKEFVRTWLVRDTCGKSASATQLISVRGSAPPTVTPPGTATVACGSSTAPAATGTATATSACNRVTSIAFVDTFAPACGATGAISRAWYAIDDCGLRSANAVQTINIGDSVNPTITVSPAEFSVPCTDATNPFARVAVSAFDACGRVTVTFSDAVVQADANCANRTITRTYTATDQCGRTATATSKAFVFDTTAPEFVSYRPTVAISCTENSGTNGPAGNAVARDGCSAVTVSSSDAQEPAPGAPACTTNKIIRRTFTATDGCGNRATVQQVITIVDRTPPTWTSFEDNVVVECGTSPAPATPTATDACGAVTVAVASVSNVTGCGATFVRFTTYTATDLCGNAIQRTQRLQVLDSRPPSITLTTPTPTIACSANRSLEAVGGYTITDACDPRPRITFTDRPLQQCGNAGIFDRTIVAVDSCNNRATATQRITVSSAGTNFTLANPNPTVQCGANITAPVLGGASFNSSCSTPVVVTFTDSGSLSPVCGTGTIKRTWTANDGCNLPATVTQTITVIDNVTFALEQPNVRASCPGPIAAAVAPALLPAPVYSSPCPRVANVTFADQGPLGPCSAPYILRTFTANDGCTTRTAVQNITLEVPRPVISVANFTYNCGVPPTPNITGTPTYSGTCGRANTTFTFSDQSSLLCDGGIVLRTWTSNDGCFVTNITQTIRILSTVNLTLPANELTVECTANLSATSPAALNSFAVYQNSCGRTTNVTFADSVSNGCGATRNITRTWTAAPPSGSAGCTPLVAVQTIRVQDTLPPVFVVAPPSTEVICGSPFVFANATAVDACSGPAPVFVNQTASPVMVPGTMCPTRVERLFTATDACGNRATYTQIVTFRGQI